MHKELFGIFTGWIMIASDHILIVSILEHTF